MFTRTFLLPTLLSGLVYLLSGPGVAKAMAMPQASTGNTVSELRPVPTSTGHEIGMATEAGVFHVGMFLPRARYRYQFQRTAAQGPLSGFWLEGMIGPAVYRDPDGVVSLNLGYEFAPFSDLALTFSPVIRNDLLFDVDWALFSQSYGASARLYINGHWVVFVNPFAFGWYVGRGGHVDFAYQGGVGFGYKF